MRLLILILFLFIGLSSYSQGGYGGVIYDKHANIGSIRPWVNKRINQQYIAGMEYYSVIGAGMNTLGNISLSVGFDMKGYSFSETAIIGGFSVELMGWDEVYKNFMPSFRLGVETEKFMVLGISNWNFKPILIGSEKALQPNLVPTIGLFYKIN